MKIIKSKISLIIALALALLLVLSLCACSTDTDALAGDVSQVSAEAEDAVAADAEAEETATDAKPGDAKPGDVGPEDFLADVPEWSGYAFCYINGNVPDFAPEEIWTSTQESLDQLDDLGRCGTANSCIGVDGMPTQGRGNISSIEPSGWHTERYDFVEGEALYNRCHLIAHMLSGDDAVPRNLITGTSYMNRDGMLPFEEAIANYVRGTQNHVMYRVTPVFVDDELIARGVHMQAISVEDQGEGLAFNVYCYNVQPGIDIDYETGDNKLSKDKTALEDYQAGKFFLIANTRGMVPETGSEESDFAAQPNAEAETQEPQKEESKSENSENEETEPQTSPAQKYVLNTNTHKFHYPECNSVKQMADHNKKVVEESREVIMKQGFEPCGNCHP